MQCLIVDDHAQVRFSLASLISKHFPDLNLLEAKTGEEAVTLAGKSCPEVVLMDVRLEGISGIEATRRIKETLPQARVIMVSIYDYEEFRRDAERAGACAYVPKTRLGRELVPALHACLLDRKLD